MQHKIQGKNTGSPCTTPVQQVQGEYPTKVLGICEVYAYTNYYSDNIVPSTTSCLLFWLSTSLVVSSDQTIAQSVHLAVDYTKCVCTSVNLCASVVCCVNNL